MLESVAKLFDESVYSLHLKREGGKVRLECVMLDGLEVRLHVWGVVAAKSGWEVDIAGHLATVLATSEVAYAPQSLVYGSDRRFVQSVAASLEGYIPLLIPELDVDWLIRVFQAEILKGLHGLDPIAFVSYLRCRLESAVGTPFMDRMPVLSKVIIIYIMLLLYVHLC